jgi:hypothetical protein
MTGPVSRQVVAWPGLGRLLIDSDIHARQRPGGGPPVEEFVLPRPSDTGPDWPQYRIGEPAFMVASHPAQGPARTMLSVATWRQR